MGSEKRAAAALFGALVGFAFGIWNGDAFLGCLIWLGIGAWVGLLFDVVLITGVAVLLLAAVYAAFSGPG